MPSFSVTSKPEAIAFADDVQPRFPNIILCGERFYRHGGTNVMTQIVTDVTFADDREAALFMLEFGSKYGLVRIYETPAEGFVYIGIKGVNFDVEHDGWD